MLPTSTDSDSLLGTNSMSIYESSKVHPYVYICTHKETGHFYIGYREVNKVPSDIDLPKYRTSSKTVNPNFQNYYWSIIAEFFNGDDAYDFEQKLIYENWGNLKLINNSCYYLKKRFNASCNRFSKEKFIRLSNIKHQNKYLYNNVEYKNAITPVIFTCRIHGNWLATPRDHSAGHGCPKCGNIQKGISKKKIAFDKFIVKSNKVHNNKFKYDEDTFESITKLMTINCPEHGSFRQSPDVHQRSKYACPGCLSNYRKVKWENYREDKLIFL
jgi:predicted RNA-binding Zn-ribbon protein involved in translation (DUF1610 family)